MYRSLARPAQSAAGRSAAYERGGFRALLGAGSPARIGRTAAATISPLSRPPSFKKKNCDTRAWSSGSIAAVVAPARKPHSAGHRLHHLHGVLATPRWPGSMPSWRSSRRLARRDVRLGDHRTLHVVAPLDRRPRESQRPMPRWLRIRRAPGRACRTVIIFVIVAGLDPAKRLNRRRLTEQRRSAPSSNDTCPSRRSTARLSVRMLHDAFLSGGRSDRAQRR